MTDRIAGEGADDYAVNNPDATATRVGYAGWVQGKVADNLAAGRINPITRATAAGKLQYLASTAGFTVLSSSGTSYTTSSSVLNSSGTSYSVTKAVLASDGTSYTVN